MQFYNYDNNEFVTLEKVAEAIAPLLRPLLQPAPAPADVPSANARIAALETALDSVRGERDWFMAQLAEAKQAQPADARLLALDAAKQRAELQRADAQQAREQAQAAWWEARQEIEALRAQLDDANAQCGSLAADLAAMTADRDEWREERQRMAMRLAAVRRAVEAAQD